MGREPSNDENEEAVDSTENEVEPVSNHDEDQDEEDDVDAELAMWVHGRRQVVEDSKGGVDESSSTSSVGSISQEDQQKFDSAAPADDVPREVVGGSTGSIVHDNSIVGEEEALFSSPLDETAANEVWQRAMTKHETQEELVNQLEEAVVKEDANGDYGTVITDQNHDDDFENMLHTILNKDDEKGSGDINHGAVTPSTNLDGDIAKIVSTQSADMNPSSTLDEDAEEGSRDGQDSTDDSAAGGEEDIAKSTSVQSTDMDPLDGVEDDDGQQQVIGQESSTAKWLYEICARVQSPLPTLQLSHAVHSAIQTGRQDVSKMQASLFELFGEGEQNVKILFEVMEKADAIRLVTKVDLNKIAKEKWGAGLGLEFSAAGVSTSHTTQVPASHNDGLRTQETDPQSDPKEMAEEGRAIETPPPPAASSKNTEGAKGSRSFPWSDKRDNFIIAALLFVVAGLVAAVVYIALSHWAVTTNGDSGGVATTNQNGNEAILDGPQTFPYPPSPVPLSSSWAPFFNSTQRLAEICPTYIGTIFDPDFNRSCGDTIIEADGNSLFVNKCGISYFVRSDGGSVALNSAPLSDVSVSDEFFLLGFSESNSNGTGAQLFVMEPTSMYNFPIILSDLGDLNLPTKVDIDQDVMAIAVPGDGQNQGGYVFIYRKSNISSIVPLATKLAWIQEAKLTPNPLNLYEFGDTIVVKQNLVMVGDRRYAAGKGAVFVYEFDSASSLWKGAQDASPLLSNDCSYSFGKSLAVTNDGELLIGCGGDRKFQKEAVYFYSRSNTGNFVLGQQVVISARDACPHCGKGKIELDGDSAIMAVATSYSSSYAGGLYFFTQTSGSWKEAAAIDIPSDEEGWRSDFAFLNNTFLISTQRNVHKYTLGDCSPTNQPTSQPTNEAERKLCFETNDRLKSAVDEYIVRAAITTHLTVPTTMIAMLHVNMVGQSIHGV